jgi:hypothetical protein
MSALGTQNQRMLDSLGNKIVALVNQSQLLLPEFPVKFELIRQPPSNNTYAKFSLNEDSYSMATYFIDDSAPRAGYLTGAGRGVKSNLGKRTGTFLFHLQLLLMLLSGAQVFYLENFTDEPARAAKGIYSLLNVNKTKRDTGAERSEFTGARLDDQLMTSEGQMRLIVDANSLNKWLHQMRELGSKLEMSGSPWNSETKLHMEKFIGFLGQNFSGGKKFSKKTTKKTRKKRKNFKKKKGNRKSKKRKSKN